jgi:hypothetical protein
MKRCRRLFQARGLSFEQCEDRTLCTLVFVLNGNAYSDAQPSELTAQAARVLNQVFCFSRNGTNPLLE